MAIVVKHSIIIIIKYKLLNIHYEVAPRWLLAPRDVSAVAGGDAVVQCRAAGSPPPSVTWRKAEGDVPRRYHPIETLGDNVR